MFRKEAIHIENRGAFTRAEAAEYINISLPVLDELIRRQHNPIPAVKLGRKVIIPVKGLEAWLAEESERQRGTAV